VASVFFAVFLAIIMRGFKHGVWVNLIDNVLHSYTGYVQLHSKGYWDNRTFDYTMSAEDSVFSAIKNDKQVRGMIPRLESFSLASSGDKTKGVITVGIDPDLEDGFTQLSRKVVAGRYFTASDSGVMLSERLSRYLNMKVNDSIVLLSQGYQGMSASGIYRIVGVVRLPSPEFDNQLVYMPLPIAQNFYSAQGRLTSMIVDLKHPQKMDQTIRRIKNRLHNNSFEVLSWKEMLVELHQQYVSNEGSGVILISLLYLIVGFGVFGTVLMMISERKHEFGVMITVGMQRHRLMKLIGTELFFICLMGLLIGFLFSLPIVAYFHFYPIHVGGNMSQVYAAFGMEPIIPTAWELSYIIEQVYIVFGIVLVVLLYPMYSLYKLDITQALRR